MHFPERKGEPEMEMEAEREFKLPGGFRFSLNLIVLPRMHHQGGSRLKPECSSDSHKARCRHQNGEMSRKRLQTLEKGAEEGAVHLPPLVACTVLPLTGKSMRKNIKQWARANDIRGRAAWPCVGSWRTIELLFMPLLILKTRRSFSVHILFCIEGSNNGRLCTTV